MNTIVTRVPSSSFRDCLYKVVSGGQASNFRVSCLRLDQAVLLIHCFYRRVRGTDSFTLCREHASACKRRNFKSHHCGGHRLTKVFEKRWSTSCFMKLFKTKVKDIVCDCMLFFNFEDFSSRVMRRKRSFLGKFVGGLTSDATCYVVCLLTLLRAN